MNGPRISIITVVYNAVDLLEGTIQSILEQTYSNIEYVVVDGASKDGTVDIIHKYKDRIDQWVSEPDKGLYNAMNKGLNMATGDFVWFMNAGDRLYTPDTLEKAVAHYTPETDLLFGEIMLVNEQREKLGTRSELTTQRLPKQLTWKSLKRGMVVCHQGFIIRRECTDPYLEDNWTADIDWVINALKKCRETKHTGIILAEFLQGGVSKKRHNEFLRDRYIILKKHYGFIPNLWNHFLIVLRAGWFKVSRFGKARY